MPADPPSTYLGPPAREYRVALVWRALAAATSAASLLAVLIASEVCPDPYVWPVVCVGIVLSVTFGFVFVEIHFHRIRLWPDAIEFRELGRGTTRLPRAEIVGIRVLPTGYFTTHLFVLTGERADFETVIPNRHDVQLHGWLASLPDLDAIVRAHARAEVAGAMAATRSNPSVVVDAAHRTSRAWSKVAMATAAWAFLFPRPYWLAVACASMLPFVAFVLLFRQRGLYSFELSDTHARPTLLGFLAPPIAVGLRAQLDLNFVDGYPIVVGASVVGLLVLAVTYRLDDALRASSGLFWSLPIAIAISAGPMAEANVLLDAAAPKTFRAEVVDYHSRSGAGARTEVLLGAWGPYPEEQWATVGSGLYDELRIGDTLCVELRPGALGARWYRVLRCRRSARMPR